METFAKVRANLDELKTRIADMDRMTRVLMARIESARQLLLTKDQVTLDLVHITFATRRNTRRLLLQRMRNSGGMRASTHQAGDPIGRLRRRASIFTRDP
jgi:hypothetical protein